MLSTKELVEKANDIQSRCEDVVVRPEDLFVSHIGDGVLAMKAANKTVTIDPVRVLPSLAMKSRMPGDYLKRLVKEDPHVAALAIESGLRHTVDSKGVVKPVKLRIYNAPDAELPRLRAVVSERYLNISNAAIINAINEVYTDGQFTFQSQELDEYGLKLACKFNWGNDGGAVGNSHGGIWPGFFAVNSETTEHAFSIMARLFRLVCTNGLILAVNGSGGSARRIHIGTGDNGDAIARDYIRNSGQRLREQMAFGLPMIIEAEKKPVKVDELYHGLRKKECFTQHTLENLFEGFIQERPSCGDTLWGAVNGITRAAQRSTHSRFLLEQLAGKVIAMPEKNLKGLTSIGREYIEAQIREGKAVTTLN